VNPIPNPDPNPNQAPQMSLGFEVRHVTLKSGNVARLPPVNCNYWTIL
jgi:hypothetical protein